LCEGGCEFLFATAGDVNVGALFGKRCRSHSSRPLPVLPLRPALAFRHLPMS
jgi:hypothetical protein